MPWQSSTETSSRALRFRDAENIIKVLGPYRNGKTEGIIIGIVNNLLLLLAFLYATKTQDNTQNVGA